MANTRNIPELEQERPECALCEQMLADALDETLDAADQVWFERHLAGCESCRQMLAEAKQGAAWLDMLKMSPPEPSAELFDRIIAQTSAAEPLALPVPGPQLVYAAAAVPVEALPSNVLPFRPRRRMGSFTRLLLEPRLAMTAAMAFFSIALTMNLLGVRLNEVHASDLRPDNLRHSFFAARASAVRSYDNLRVVHVMESRLEDIQSLSDQAQPEREHPQAAPESQPTAPANAPREQDENQPPALPQPHPDAPGVGHSLNLEPAWPVRRSNAPALTGRNGGLS